jgi:amino acid transporter
MPEPVETSWLKRLRKLVIGAARSPLDRTAYHRLSLIAFFAWVGLGADGLSSSCYGPPEAFLALKGHVYLGMFVALATALTIFVISTSYSQIIELFPHGGGGYIVASKLLSPRLGMVAGCALLVDYVLTITVSIASGTDALFSFFPPQWQSMRIWVLGFPMPAKLAFSVGVILILTLLNMRGVKESVLTLLPIFVVFVLTHAFVIVYALIDHAPTLGNVFTQTAQDTQRTVGELGLWGTILLIVHAYSMGAGTYTGIEAVSNGLPMLREPRVQTGKRTMRYMAISLAVTVVGLMLAYLLYGVQFSPSKTLNAVLLENVTDGWGGAGTVLVIVTLASEGALLYVAAQTGFLDGPRVLSNMALDRWFPTRLSLLSDRLVTQNGVLLMCAAALVTMTMTGGNVGYLVVLYSINVFITFLLSQTGMVRHWWQVRRKLPKWRGKMLINGVGAGLTLLILVWVTVIKFHEGGWMTLLVTGSLVLIVSLIRRYYNRTSRLVRKFDTLTALASAPPGADPPPAVPCDLEAKTAAVLVSGFNGLGMHTLLNTMRYFGDTFRNFVFVQVGIVDAGNFKGAAEIDSLQKHVRDEVDRYVQFVRRQGFHAEGFTFIGTDVAEVMAEGAPQIVRRFPQAVFFAGQLLLPKETLLTRWLNNNIVFAIQRRLYQQGIPFVIMPIRG